MKPKLMCRATRLDKEECGKDKDGKETDFDLDMCGKGKTEDYLTDEYDLVVRDLNSTHKHRFWNLAMTVVTVCTIPRYPENQNNMLPLELLRKLDAMSPADFKTYVLSELTLEERESLMVDEKQRRKTFLAKWPHHGSLRAVRMAQCGFYSIDDFDRVQCVFCRGSLQRWQPDEDPMEEHARSFKFCRFVKGLPCGNIEFISRMDHLDPEDMKNVNIYENQAGSTSKDKISMSMLGIATDRAAKIDYAPEASRLQTFTRFPRESPVQPHALANAGFYFTGFDDNVRCFYCDGAIRSWGENDDPWVEHARWFPECAFLIQQKSQDYVDKVHAETPDFKKTVKKTQSQKKQEKKKIKEQSIQQDITDILVKLGYDAELIKKALKTGDSGRPVEDIVKVIDNIDELTRYPNAEKSTSQAESMMMTEDDTARMDAQEETVNGVENGGETSELACKVCEKKLGKHVPATRIGLPCGHVIFCDSCDSNEKNRILNQLAYKSRCPRGDCKTQLTGTIKFFLA